MHISLDRQGDLDEASRLYKKAIAKHPKDATAYNDLGLCFHRRGMLEESAQTLRKAVEMAPDREVYRNNLAMVLVDLDRDEEALKQLQITSPPAVADYNLAYLLHRKGNDAEARPTNSAWRTTRTPTLAGTLQWIAKLETKSGRRNAEQIASSLPDERPVPAAAAETDKAAPVARIAECRPPPSLCRRRPTTR